MFRSDTNDRYTNIIIMGITLSAAKTKLEMDLKQAFFDAYMTQYEPNNIPQAAKYDNDTKIAMQKKADDFSISLSKDLATAIYDFVKEIGITVTLSGTVISPSGPCTGTIPITSFTIS